MIKIFSIVLLSALVMCELVSCSGNKSFQMQTIKSATKGTYAYDKQFLQQHDSNLVELKIGNAAVIVSPGFQAKVFTSTAEGDNGSSFGWINYKAFGAPRDPHMNAYGGENRFWLGPEGGKYSLFFKQGDSMVFDNWKTPAPIDTEAWRVIKEDDESVTLRKNISISNYAGTPLSMLVTRIISIQDKKSIENSLSVELGDSVKFTGYTTNNVIQNTGSEAWSEPGGMPCIWILDMFNPTDATTIVIPHKPAEGKEKVATTNYFGEIPRERIAITDKALFFKADGKSRGKLGIIPRYALPFAGSYDARNNVLTITAFSVDNDAKYLNQEWNTVKPVFSGDAMNAYNDGPLSDGTQMGPFYELESVSPAAELQPSEEMQHTHSVYHFTGKKEELDLIAQKVLGVTLREVQLAFK